MTFRPLGVTGAFRGRAALSLALGAALLATSLPARAADDDVPIDRKIFGSILEGLGLRRDGEAINYQERPPLVIPPSRNLPPPETVDRALANNPAWPKDPDVVRRKREAQQERNRNISDEREREQNPLRPDQLTPGGDPRTARRSTGDANSVVSGTPLSPGELNNKKSIWSSVFGKQEEEVGRFTREPPRTALTEPPPGYQTPSPDQPYGLSKSTTITKPKAENYLETHGTAEGR